MEQLHRPVLQNDLERLFHPETGRGPLWIEEMKDAVFIRHRCVSSIVAMPFAYQEVVMNHWDQLVFEYDPKSPFKRVWSRADIWVEMFERALDGCRRVLDVGCGAGFLAVPLARRFEIYGCDHSLGMLDLAAKRAAEAGVTIALTFADTHALPFEDNYFDAVYCKFAIWPLKDPATGLAEMARVVKRGGRVVVAEVDRQKKYDPGKVPLTSKLLYAVYRIITRAFFNKGDTRDIWKALMAETRGNPLVNLNMIENCLNQRGCIPVYHDQDIQRKTSTLLGRLMGAGHEKYFLYVGRKMTRETQKDARSNEPYQGDQYQEGPLTFLKQAHDIQV